jgi:hypothetical protein
VPKTSSGKISIRESDAPDTTVLANLAGLASQSAAALNALLRMNSRRLIMIVSGSDWMSAAERKSLASECLSFLKVGKSLLKLLKCRKSIYSLRPANLLFKHASLPEPLSAKLAVSGKTHFALQPAPSLLCRIG